MTNTSRDSETIEDDIRETRAGIDHKLQQIQDRLSPGDVVDGVVDFVRANGGSLAGSVGRGIRDNPVPATLIGAGVLWLTLSSLRRRDDVQAYSERAHESIRHKTADLREGAGHRASQVAEQAGEAGQAAAAQARRARRASGRFVQDHPVVVGAAGLLLGAAVAASLPRWQREDDLYGAQSDQVKDAARRKAEEKGQDLQSAARQAVDKARQTAEERVAEAGRPNAATGAGPASDKAG